MKSWRENPKDGLVTVEVRRSLISSLSISVKGYDVFLTRYPSTQCSPYHFEDKVLLLGDAAHAMVPFYGALVLAPFVPFSTDTRRLLS